MANSDTIYVPDIGLPQELIRARTQTVKLPLHRHGQLIAPTSGTYSLFNQSNGKLIDEQAVVVTNDVATASVTAAVLDANESLGEGWREEWTLLVSGTTDVYERDASVIRKRLQLTVSDKDLEDRYSDLARFRGERFGSYQPFREEAFKVFKMRLIQDGHHPYLIRTPSSTRNILLHHSLHLIFLDFHTGVNGESKWFDLAKFHLQEYERLYDAHNFKADYDHDGMADSDEDGQPREQGARNVHVNSPPHRRYFSKFGVI